MARIVKIGFFVLIIIFGLSFTALNPEPVQINYYFGADDIPLAQVVFMAMLAGALFVAIFYSLKVLRLKREIASLRKTAGRSENQDTDIRSVPIRST